MRPQHVKGCTYHKRLDGTKNVFRYGVDYVLLEPENISGCPTLFAHNQAGLMAFHDRDHGGEVADGSGANWVRQTLQGFGHSLRDDWRVLLLAQPRMVGTKFTPVSFWLVIDEAERLRIAIAEVNNTFGDRHSYLCMNDELMPITAGQRLSASKLMHVSPFQPQEGEYQFSFNLTIHSVRIRIEYHHNAGGLLATLSGDRTRLTNQSIIAALLRRPFGSVRVLALIHFQALKLWTKGVGYRPRPDAPEKSVSR